MLRLLARLRRPWPPPPWRRRLSVPPSAAPPPPPLDLKPLPSSSSPPLPSLSSPHLPSTLPRRRSFPTLLAAVSGVALVSAFALLETPGAAPSLNETLERSKNSARRVLDQMRHTGAAAAVLWKSLSSVLSSANQEVRSGFELRVAALLADIAAASGTRRAAIVGAGNGTVVDWLLESVGRGGAGRRGTQAEAARALAHLVADKDVSSAVLGRPHAVPYLLRFIFSFQPKGPKKQYKYSSFDDPGLCKGRSMLVAALMDIVTSNCDNPQQSTFRPLLPGNADMRDIAAAIEVIEEGGMHFDDHNGNEDNSDGGKEMRGIGIKVLGGTSVLGFSRAKSLLKLEDIGDEALELDGHVNRTVAFQKNDGGQSKVRNLAFSTVPGLWDDLQGEHVAVPFAAWALANWALASGINRSHIQELDRDGHAVTAALTAPERSVKWHGSLVARALLSDQNLPLTDSVPEWSSSLLATVSQASKVQDAALSQVALSAFSVSVERSKDAKVVLIEKGLPLMREIAKQMEKHRHIQEALATVLELLYKEDMHFSLEESQRWSGILLRWVFSKFSSETTCSSATKILSCILEDYGPNTIPISQGWLTILLTEVLGASKTSTLKGSSPVKTDKVKTQIDQSNALLAAQVANQLASAVVKVAGNQSELDPSSPDKHPLADFLLIDPFAAQLKNLSKSNSSKFDAADSAFATLKGIKALTELCSEDAMCKNKLNDLGGLCLLRRFLLSDDYEKLAAFEAYDASRVLETQDRDSAKSNDSSASDSNNSTSVRVPSTAHIRRHAARLLTVLSLQPNIKKVIAADGILCKWLDDCASGRIPCCNDHKIQSYARATLLNIFCLDEIDRDRVVGRHPGMVSGNEKSKCPQYADMIFLINPESLHWKISDNHDDNNSSEDAPAESVSPTDFLPTCSDNGIESKTSNNSSSVDDSDKVMQSAIPLFDIVFVHGLRGGPFKSWRIADDKSSTTSKSGLVEKIDQEAGKEGTFWPSEWLAADFPDARFYTVKYKTNLTQWSGASLPLQEVSSLLLQKLAAAGIGDRPVVFVAHSMGGLVVKQMLYQAKMENYNELVNNTIGVVFYSCPHFGSRLADMPWRMGLVFRPAPSIGELRSGSPRLVELNDFVRQCHNKGLLEVLSFSETQVTPIVEGYGGWAFRLEIVPIESAYPGFGELVVLDATDHVNSCKPVNRSDPSYAKTLDFLQKLKARMT